MQATGDFGFGVAARVVVAGVVEAVECVVAPTEAVALGFAGIFGFLAPVAAVVVGVFVVVRVLVDGEVAVEWLVGVLVVDGDVAVEWLVVTTSAAVLVTRLLDPPHPASARTPTAAASRSRRRLIAASPLAGDEDDQVRRDSTAGPG
ncbi:MAG: hypothetical protein ABSG43_25155, partial [Solirubrobacteraceae bacterium]